MSTPSRYANGNARRKVRAWLKAQGLPCHICGRPIDYSLPAGDPMSFEVDEVVPVSRGGSPIDRGNVAPAHRVCNERRGNRPLPARSCAKAEGRAGDAPGIPSASPCDILAAVEDAYGPRAVDVGCRTSRRW